MAPIRCSNKDAPSWFIYLVKECRFCMINRCNKVHTMTMGKRTTKNNWLLHKMLKIYIGHKDLEIRIELIKHNHGFQWRLAIFVVFFFPSFPSSLLNSALCIFSNCHSFSEERVISFSYSGYSFLMLVSPIFHDELVPVPHKYRLWWYRIEMGTQIYI